jgi:hypothetical protein
MTQVHSNAFKVDYNEQLEPENFVHYKTVVRYNREAFHTKDTNVTATHIEKTVPLNYKLKALLSL